MAHKSNYRRHKQTKHRTMEVPEGFEFVTTEHEKYNPRRIRVVFKKKGAKI